MYTVEEHKKKIAEKLNKLRSTEQLGDDNSDIMDHTHSEDDFGIATGDSGQAQEESGGQEIEGAQNDVSTMVYRMLGCGMCVLLCCYLTTFVSEG